MTRSVWHTLKRHIRRTARSLLASLPAAVRFKLYRRAIDFSPAAGPALELKIAATQDELEACFALLHDAYVASGFQRPHPSGLRVTPYHALPTTTTLCAKIDGQVVGTLSIVRDGIFGFPMQTAFDISSVRAKGGRIAEISALAVHPRFRKTGGSILFPLMKFMYEYCTRYFDTDHLLIAVNPSHIEMYESLLFFQRLTAQEVDRYDFANGAPAVGATLDLKEAPGIFERAYAGKPGRRNLHHYFVNVTLPEIQFPPRVFHVSNDPMLTPALLHHFFSVRTEVFSQLDERRRRLLHSIYPAADWAAVLPPLPSASGQVSALRASRRLSMKCPATLRSGTGTEVLEATIVEISMTGFSARLSCPLEIGARFEVVAELGKGDSSTVQAEVVRLVGSDVDRSFGFRVERSDGAWRRCARWLEETENAFGKTASPKAASPALLPA